MTLIALYVVIHYLFVSQTSQVLALFGVFLDVGTRGGVPVPLMSFGLLFASSYFSVITPQGGSQNIIFAASGYLTQPELYKLGLITTLFFLAVYLLIGSPWVCFVMSGPVTTPHIEVRKTPDTTPHGRSPAPANPAPSATRGLRSGHGHHPSRCLEGAILAKSPSRRPDRTVAQTQRRQDSRDEPYLSDLEQVTDHLMGAPGWFWAPVPHPCKAPLDTVGPTRTAADFLV